MSEVEELREATREAHEATKDLKQVMKDARDLLAEIEFLVASKFTTIVDKKIEKGMEDYKEAIGIAIDEATEATYRRFDQITDVLMGETKENRKEGLLSLPQYAEMIAQLRDAGKIL